MTLALAKKFTEDTAVGLGAVKGAPCTISTIEDLDDHVAVQFKWTGTDGTEQSRIANIKHGVSVVKLELMSNNELFYTLSDGTVESCGTVNVTVAASDVKYTTSKDNSISNMKQAMDKALSVNAESLTYANSLDENVKNVKGALDALFEDGGGNLEEIITPNVSIGSVKTSYPIGTPLEEIIRDILTEKIAPTINVLINPSTTLYDETKDSISSLTINASVSQKTNALEKIEYYVNNNLVHTNTNVAGGGTFPYIYNREISDDTSIKVVVTDTEGLSATATKSITFVGRSYYGYIEPDVEVNEAVIKTLQHNVLQNTKALTYSGINCSYHRIVYCYDKAFGELSTIIDPINNFSYNNSFEKKTITVDGIEKWCYILIQATGADDAVIRFS